MTKRHSMRLFFRDEYGGGTDRYADIQCQKAGMPSHDLHQRASLVGLHGVPQPVDAFDGRVAGGVEADGIVRTSDIIVYRGRNACYRNAKAGQLQSAPEVPSPPIATTASRPRSLAYTSRLHSFANRTISVSRGDSESFRQTTPTSLMISSCILSFRTPSSWRPRNSSSGNRATPIPPCTM